MLKTFVAAACAALVVRFFHSGFDTCSGIRAHEDQPSREFQFQKLAEHCRHKVAYQDPRKKMPIKSCFPKQPSVGS